jgi:hypothetical protein
MMREDQPSPGVIVRRFLAVATLAFGIGGLWLRAPGAFVAAGALGTMWWAWDLLNDNVFTPFGDWLSGLLTGDALAPDDSDPLTLDETARLLEHRLQPGVAPHIVVQAAIRLEEIYRLGKQDPVRARGVIQRARELVGNVAELARYE